MNTATLGIIIAIVLYLAFLLYLGFRYAKANETTADFYLGGRQLGPLVTAMSAEASDMSSWLLMGLPGVAYLTGICEPFWTALGLGVGTYFNWLLVARRLRHYTEKLDAVTLPEFFQKRFKDKSHVLMLVSAVVIVVFFVPYVASGFNACGTLFSSLFGIDYTVAMLISAVVIVVYTAVGGFLAASTTDFVQSIVMSIALIVVLCFGVSTVGGFQAVSETAAGLEGFLSFTHVHDVSTGSAGSYGGVLGIVSTMAWGLGYCGMPHILVRFMAIKDPRQIKTARRVGTAWVFIAMAVAIFIGVVGLSMTQAGVMEDLTVNGSTSAQRAIIRIAQLLSELGFLPALLAGVVMAGILACTMSTCDSQLLAASSSISEDILRGVFGLKISQKATMIIARATLVLVSVFAAIWAWSEGSVFAIVSFAWAGFGAAFGPVVIMALFWKRANRWGAIAGMLGGGITVFVWEYVLTPLGGIFGLYELLPAFIVNVILIVVVSLLTGKPDQDTVDMFQNVKAIKD